MTPNERLSQLNIDLPEQYDGLNTYAVGGAVRALYTGNPVTDIDLMIQGASMKELIERDFTLVVSGATPPGYTTGEFHSEATKHAHNGEFFDFLHTVEGNQFPVFLDDHNREVALARTEKSTGNEHTAFQWDASPDVTVEEDLSRRDLTCNALCVDLTTGELRDPFDGRDDIENELIRQTTPGTFSEDPLRILRMARFAARLDFTVTEATLDAAREHSDSLMSLPNERLGSELIKAMKQAAVPSRFFHILDAIDALDIILPELAALKGIASGPSEYHKEGGCEAPSTELFEPFTNSMKYFLPGETGSSDAFAHTMLVLDEMNKLHPHDERALFAALGHDLGKAETPTEQLPSHYRHHVLGVDLMENIQERLVLPRELTGVMETASRYHMRMHNLDELGERTILEMVDTLRNDYSVSNPEDEPVLDHVTPDELISLWIADSRGRIPHSTPKPSRAVELFENAERVLDSIGGEYVLNNFDPNSGEHIGELIEQERIRAMQNPEQYDLTIS